MTQYSDNNSKKEIFVFKLFVAGDEHHSNRARANLKAICETHLKDRYQVEIIDVFTCFELAIENDIFLSPALVKESPGPRVVIFGNLNSTADVLQALRLDDA